MGRLLLRDLHPGAGGKGEIAIAADCVTVELRIGVQLRPGAGGRGQPQASECQDTLAF